MQKLLEEARKRIRDIWERKKDTTANDHLSIKGQEEVQRAKNFKRSQEDDKDTRRADKEVKEKGFL